MELQGYLSAYDCSIECCQENKPNNGEDSYVRSVNKQAGLVGVFDGCGGSGAKKYSKYSGKTGAFMASRVVCGATKDWFYEFCDHACFAENPGEDLKKKVFDYLSICKHVSGEESALKGFMSKDFPTTASIVITWTENELLKVLCLWAGDSRCYMLNEDGLFQLTEDDLDVSDAMDNLTSDGVLTNVISTSKDFCIHSKCLEFNRPCVLFAASDGCFGYYPTPMEFEYSLLETLQKSSSIAEWELLLKHRLSDVAGDDLSLYGYAFLYGSFKRLRSGLEQRRNIVMKKYINRLSDFSPEDRQSLWISYKGNYERYLHKKVRNNEEEDVIDSAESSTLGNDLKKGKGLTQNTALKIKA